MGDGEVKEEEKMCAQTKEAVRLRVCVCVCVGVLMCVDIIGFKN